MNQIHENQKSTRGNSALGVKSYFILGFIASSILNIGGVAKVIDSFVEWTGIIQRFVNLYTIYIIDNVHVFIGFITRLAGIDALVPIWASTYASISTSSAVMYLFAAKIADLDTNRRSGIIGVLRGLPPARLFQTWFSKNGAFLGKSLEDVKSQSILLSFFSVLFSIIFFVVAWIFLTTVLLTILPVIVVSSSYKSVAIYFNHDFYANPLNNDEKSEFDRLRFIYNSTLVFWYCMVGSIIAVGILIKVNDVIQERCSQGDINASHWICKNSRHLL